MRNKNIENMQNRMNEKYDKKRVSEMTLKEQMAAYDRECKLFVAEKPVLAQMVKDCVSEYEDVPIKDIEEFYLEEPVISETPEEEEWFDVLVKVKLPDLKGKIELIINLDATRKFVPDHSFLKKMEHYMHRAMGYREETRAGKDQDTVRKVYGIWICPNAMQEKNNVVKRFGVKEVHVMRDGQEVERKSDLLEAFIFGA